MKALIIVFLVALVAGFGQALSGFGYAIIIMALLPLALPAQLCPVIAILGGFFINIPMLIRYRSHLQLKLILIPAIFSTMGVLIGLLTDFGIETAVYMRILGALLIALSLWFMIFSGKITIPANNISGAIVGSISGLCGALFAINGPPLVLYYNEAAKDKETYMAVLQCVQAIQAVSIFAARTVFSLWPAGIVGYLPALILGTAIGGVCGKRIFDKMSPALFNRIIYIVMCVSGLYFIVSA